MTDSERESRDPSDDITDISALQDFRASGSNIKPSSIEGDQRVLAFDQSLANTGYALIVGGRVIETGNLRTESSETGNESNFIRAIQVFAHVNQLTYRMAPDLIVHEAPPVGGGRIRNPEASLLSAFAIRLSAHLDDVPVRMETPQAAKKRWTGNARAKKSELKKSLLELHPYLAKIKPMNQAISDAIAVGLLSMEKHSG